MKYVNSIVLTGLTGSDPKVGMTKSNESYTFSSIAVKREEPSKATDYFSIVAFNDVANQLALFAKGTPISIRGRLEKNHYTDKNGVAKESFRIVAESITRVVE